MALHERLRKRLARFERGCGAGRADNRAPRLGEQVSDAETQWHLRTDDREIDVLRGGDRQQLLRLCQVCGDTLRDRGYAGISGGAKHAGNVAFTRKLPRHRMLARARSKDQDLHFAG